MAAILALQKPCVAKIGAKKASSCSRSAPRSVVRVVAHKQEQKVSDINEYLAIRIPSKLKIIV